MGFMSPKPPAVPMPPPAAHPPTLGSASLAIASQQQKDRNKAAEGMGEDNTVKTSPEGLSPADTTKSTLLGS